MIMAKAAGIKEVPESEIIKHKIRDIPGFVKAGNLSMVNALINFHGLGQNIMLLKGLQEDFVLTKTPAVQKLCMVEWNPFLVAVAFKRVDIIRYFVEDLKISQRLACSSVRFPESHPFAALPVTLQSYLFPLHLAIINHDQNML